MAKRRRYTDQFRADAVLMLESQGYPENEKTSLSAVARHLGMPESTLRSWYNAHVRNENKPNSGEPPAEVYDHTKKDLKQMLRNEIDAILESMPDGRQDASYRDQGWVLGVLFDKLQLLNDKPTAIIKLQEAIEQGKITKEEASQRWPALMRQYEHINA